jgi:hypothetical protein
VLFVVAFTTVVATIAITTNRTTIEIIFFIEKILPLLNNIIKL